MTWKGSKEIHEAPTSPKREKSVQGLRITRVFNGPFASLVAAEPSIGQVMEGYEGIPILTVSTEPLEAGPTGPGRMTIVAGNDDLGGGGTGGIDPIVDLAPTYEIEWTQLEQPLLQHPMYAAGASVELTPADLANLEQWKQESDPALKAVYKFKATNGSEVTLSPNAQHYAGKVRRGIESYFVPAPVCRKTTRHFTKPQTSAMGRRQNPPGDVGAPPGYVWLVSADRAIRQGRGGTWERITEWLGAQSWDTDIYPAG
jgi:hypothetical protein